MRCCGLSNALARWSREVPPGATLFLNAGSTVLAVAAHLKGPLTVITPSLDIAQLFSERPDIELVLLGGNGICGSGCFGSATLALLSRYRADIAILGACDPCAARA